MINSGLVGRTFQRWFELVNLNKGRVKKPPKIEPGNGGIILWVYTRKYLAIALGATTIGDAERTPDDIVITKNQYEDCRRVQCTRAYTQKNNFSTIASGATPIGSAGRAPDEIYPRILKQGRWGKKRWNIITPIGSDFLWSHGCITQIFSVK
jgi:hypothetical protein